MNFDPKDVSLLELEQSCVRLNEENKELKYMLNKERKTRMHERARLLHIIETLARIADTHINDEEFEPFQAI